MYLQSSIVHYPVHTHWREAVAVLMHEVMLFRKSGCGNLIEPRSSLAEAADGFRQSGPKLHLILPLYQAVIARNPTICVFSQCDRLESSSAFKNHTASQDIIIIRWFYKTLCMSRNYIIFEGQLAYFKNDGAYDLQRVRKQSWRLV